MVRLTSVSSCSPLILDTLLGGIVYLNALGRSIIILNDAKYAFDMLAKKSRNYSDRPKLMMAGQLVGWGEGPALIPFSETWLEYRRLFSQFIGSRSKVEGFQTVLQDETRSYINSIRDNPEVWVQHTQRFVFFDQNIFDV